MACLLILLVGPKGSGKTHIGRVLERMLGVRFFHVEPLWMEYYAQCQSAGREPSIAEGVSIVHPRIAEALQESENVCVETTGASPKVLSGLLSLTPRSRTLLVRVNAPAGLCLERIALRDPAQQIPVNAKMIGKIHELSAAAEIDADLVLENLSLSDADIVSAFRAALDAV